MQCKLSHRFSPPAPLVLVRVLAPDGTRSLLVEGQIDTGADLCTVPDWIVVELKLPTARITRAAGYEGRTEKLRLYRVDLDIEGMRFSRIEAAASRPSFAIIGRTVLRHLVLQIDGPKETFQLSRPRSTPSSPSRTRSRS